MNRASQRPQRDIQERYRVLLDIGRVIVGTLEPADLYRTIYEQASRVLETTRFYIALYDADQDEGTVVFHADRGQVGRPNLTYRGSDSRAIREGRPFIQALDNVDRSPRLPAADASGEEARSAISAPLRRDARVLGVISAQSYRTEEYDAADLELLEAIADLATVAIANARAMEALERQRQESQQLEEIGRALSASLDIQEVLRRITVTTRSLIHADGTAVWLLGPDGLAEIAMSDGGSALPVGTTVPVPPDLHERFMVDHTPVIIDRDAAALLLPPEIMEGYRAGSAIGVPLVAEGELIGLLAASHIQPRTYPTGDIRLLERLAYRAAIAVHNARLHERLRLLSLTDPLTGLPNRRHIEMFLEKEFAAAERGRALSVVLFDLDDFKLYNDTEGHQAGDAVLRRFAQILQGHTRAMNLAARYGGDEFIAILSDTTAEGARIYVDRVLTDVRVDDVMAGVGASAGVATYDATMATAEGLIRRADQALYRSKSERTTQPY
jgi:diguanylate cyclase (GGDEF)-like protein